MPIKGYNFAPAMFLTELTTQCTFASGAFKRLRDAAPAWYTDASAEEFERAMAPADVMIYCTVFLSAAAVISKMLFEGNRTGVVARRCKRLRELLEVSELPTLRDLAVRNSFEHIDERFDRLFSSVENGHFAILSVTESPPAPDTIVLKRFDPRLLTVSFARVELSLVDCMADITTLASKIDPAFKKLQGPQFELWAT